MCKLLKNICSFEVFPTENARIFHSSTDMAMSITSKSGKKERTRGDDENYEGTQNTSGK